MANVATRMNRGVRKKWLWFLVHHLELRQCSGGMLTRRRVNMGDTLALSFAIKGSKPTSELSAGMIWLALLNLEVQLVAAVPSGYLGQI